MAVIRKKTNKLDMVYGLETNKNLLSRYCYPRMLSAFLPVCNAEQNTEFFSQSKSGSSKLTFAKVCLAFPGTSCESYLIRFGDLIAILLLKIK
jgi:hypothetical protein